MTVKAPSKIGNSCSGHYWRQGHAAHSADCQQTSIALHTHRDFTVMLLPLLPIIQHPHCGSIAIT